MKREAGLSIGIFIVGLILVGFIAINDESVQLGPWDNPWDPTTDVGEDPPEGYEFVDTMLYSTGDEVCGANKICEGVVYMGDFGWTPIMCSDFFPSDEIAVKCITPKAAIIVTKPIGAQDPEFDLSEFDLLKDYIQEVSYGNFNLDIDLFGVYELDYNTKIDLLEDAIHAADSEINYKLYNRIFLIDQRLSASADTSIKHSFVTQDGTISILAIYLGSSDIYLPIIAHEFGHTFGLDHANKMFCDDDYHDFTICYMGAYGDEYDIMGQGSGHYNSLNKEKIGFLNSNRIRTISSSGVYTIKPLEQKNGIVLLKVPHKKYENGRAYDYYYVEYRTPTSFNSEMQNSEVQIRIGLRDNTAILSSLSTNGENFYDEATGVQISLLSSNSNEARVNVVLGGRSCIRNSPSFDLYDFRGGIRYNLTNRDSSVCFPRKIYFQSSSSDILLEPDLQYSQGCEIGECVLQKDYQIYFFPGENLVGSVVTPETSFSIDILESRRIIASQTY